MSGQTRIAGKTQFRFPRDLPTITGIMDEIEKATESNSQPIIVEVAELGLADVLEEYLSEKGFQVKITCMKSVRDHLEKDSKLHAIIFESFRRDDRSDDLLPIPFRQAHPSRKSANASCPHCGYPLPSCTP